MHLSRLNGKQVENTLAESIHEYGAPQYLAFTEAQVQLDSNIFYEALEANRDQVSDTNTLYTQMDLTEG